MPEIPSDDTPDITPDAAVPPETVSDRPRDTGQALGIWSVIIGSVSMMPFFGILSPIGLVLGIFALLRNQRVVAILGAAISAFSVATSPVLLALMFCLPSQNRCEPIVQNVKAEFHQKIQEKLHEQAKKQPPKRTGGCPSRGKIPDQVPADKDAVNKGSLDKGPVNKAPADDAPLPSVDNI